MKASDILGLDDLRTDTVEVPQWGKTLTVRELGLADGLNLFAMAQGDKVMLSGEDVARVVAAGVIDESGAPVFTDEHIPALANKNRDAMMLIYNKVIELSGSREDARKNSKASRD